MLVSFSFQGGQGGTGASQGSLVGCGHHFVDAVGHVVDVARRQAAHIDAAVL